MHSNSASDNRSIVKSALVDRALRVGEGWKRDGRKAAWTLDSRSVILDSGLILLVGALLWESAKDLAPGVLCGGGFGAAPLLAATLGGAYLESARVSGLVARPEPKMDGLRQRFDGPQVEPRARVVLLDDIANSGKTLLSIAAAARSDLDVEVCGAVVLVDFERGADEALSNAGIPMRRIFRLRELGVSSEW